jgi:hypothetical protein
MARGAHAPRVSSDTVIGILLLVAVFLLALVGQSAFFESKHAFLLGDLPNHGGVALAMQASTFQGEGPHGGLLTYLGGLYPLVLSIMARVAGWTFDRTVTVISWPATLLIPAAFAFASSKLWPSKWAVIGSVTALAPFAAPFSSSRS